MDMVGTRHRNVMLNAIGIATSDTFPCANSARHGHKSKGEVDILP